MFQYRNFSGLFPDVDPEIAAALEGEFETNEDDFDDDFILKANAHGSDDEGSSMMKGIRITDTEEKGKDALMKRFGLSRNERFSDEDSDEEEDDDFDGEYILLCCVLSCS